jgi:hypothetical protein
MAITNSLPAYVDQNRDKLIKKSILGAKSAKRFALQTGVKTSSAINLLSTSATLQAGSACGWNAAGGSTLTQRVIVAPVIKVNTSYCDKALLGSALQYDVKVAAGQKTLPFEEDFVNGVLEDVALQGEKLIWQGDTAGATGTYLDLADGLIKILKGASVIESTSANKGKILSASNIKAEVDTVFALIPAEIMGKAEIYMGYDAYRLYVMALQALNLYMGAPAQDGEETTYPGSTTKIVAVAGLNGTNQIVAANPEHVFYGTDLSGDQEKFDFWYSQDNQEFRLAIQFTQGVQVAFPDQIVFRNKANTFVA